MDDREHHTYAFGVLSCARAHVHLYCTLHLQPIVVTLNGQPSPNPLLLSRCVLRLFPYYRAPTNYDRAQGTLTSLKDLWISKEEYLEHGSSIVERKCP